MLVSLLIKAWVISTEHKILAKYLMQSTDRFCQEMSIALNVSSTCISRWNVTEWFRTYTDHAGLEIPVNSRIALLFSRQIAIGNAGPILALESMGAKQTFLCHSVNIGLINVQTVSEKMLWFGPITSGRAIMFSSEVQTTWEGRKSPFLP